MSRLQNILLKSGIAASIIAGGTFVFRPYNNMRYSKTFELKKSTRQKLEAKISDQPLDGVDELPQIMSSEDFSKLEFDSLGFTGKWLDLIGDPAPGFSGCSAF